MENRHLDKSPPKKKGRIMTKTKYFFQPTNNLVNLNAEREKDKDAEPEGEQPEAVNSIAGFSLPKDLLAGEELEANANGTLKEGSAVTPTKFIDYERLIREQQSSDDSFDGIRWGGGSPEKQKMSTGVMVGGTLAASRLHRSSPLKNETSPVNNEVFSVNNNDQVNSVLNKYGTGFDNILSQTPTLQKTYSDILSSESKRKRNKIDFPLDTSPTIMMRSKTLGIDEMKAFNEPKKKSIKPVKAATSESALNSWLTKFEDKPQKKSSQGLQMPIQVEKKLALPLKDEISNTQEVVQDIDFEDDFSDSMIEPEDGKRNLASDPFLNDNDKKGELKTLDNDLDLDMVPESTGNSNLISNSVSNLTNLTKISESLNPNDFDDFSDFSDDEAKPAIPIKIKSVDGPSGLNLDDDDDQDDDDPFSDDDLQILPISTTRINNQVSLTKQEIEKRPLTTQQLNDKKHAELFQKDVKKLELLHLQSTPIVINDEDLEVNLAKISFERPDLKRFQIKGVLRNKFKIQQKVRNQVILSVIDLKDTALKVLVRGEYFELDFQIGDIIHVVLTHGNSNHALVDDQNNLLIWNPDILVSATTVSQQMTCPRKTVLLNRFRYPGSSSIPLIVGTIIHVIFQACLAKDTWTDAFMNEILEKELEFHVLEIFSIGNELDKVRSELEQQFSYLKTWFQTYFKKPLSSKNVIPTNQRNQLCQFSVSNVLDVEENIWSPMFGIKGMVDVTLEANVQRYNNPAASGKFLLPMEIKSGREHLSHHAQSSLYALLFKDRYDIDVNSFLLLYTKEKIMKLNDISQTDLKSLVNLRNRLTKYLRDDCVELPDLLKLSVCDRCEVQKSCMTINKLVENGDQESSGLPDGVYDSLTFQLEDNPHYKDFYEFWNELLTKEESIISQLKKDLWTFTAKEREEQGGKALSHMVITEADDDDDDLKRFVYTFERSPEGGDIDSLQLSQLSKNDRVIISDEIGHFAIAQGYIMSIRPTFIVISSERRIMKCDIQTTSFNKENHQTFQGVLHKTQHTMSSESKLFRIDRDEMFHGMGLARYNILNLFMEGGDELRREVIVNLKAPSYHQNSSLLQSLEKDVDKNSFNPDQYNAFKKVISTEEYCLILGMPGTGKTTVIAKIIQFLVSMGKSVLLASYTHSAVDNILLKVKALGIKGILRVGHPARIHKDIQEFVAQSSMFSNYSEFSSTYMEPLVVATTCLGIGDIAFNLRDHFDYCIIDEASQVSMPVSLGPLRFCDKFVLVGDHHQLPPLVQHPSNRVKQGLSQSMFKMLSDKHPQSVVELTYQYRMCKEIMLLSNLLVYDGRLKCGSEIVANQQLDIPYPKNISRYVSDDELGELWMDKVLDPNNKVLFLNHDNLPGLERINGEKVENPTEVELIYQIIESLTGCGVDENRIGVMSLYRAQLRLLNRKLFHKPNVEILTADQFQGRDKDCIIISLVRSNKENRVGDLLKEWRRVNVAITRSKSKLIIIGSKSTLKTIPTLEAFMGLIESRNWMYDLEEGATDVYKFMFEEKQSPVKSKRELKVKSTTLSEKLINSHPLMKDIINEQK